MFSSRMNRTFLLKQFSNQKCTNRIKRTPPPQPLLHDTVEGPPRPSNVERITVTIWGDVWGGQTSRDLIEHSLKWGGGPEGHMVSASYSTHTNTCTHTHTQQYYIQWAGEAPSLSPLNSKPCQCIEVKAHPLILSLLKCPRLHLLSGVPFAFL